MKSNYKIITLREFKQIVPECPKAEFARYIILHDTGVEINQEASVIDQWHEHLGFKYIGYDIYISKKNLYVTDRFLKNVCGAHAKGWNKYSIGISLSGKTKFSVWQLQILAGILDILFSFNGYLILFHKELTTNRSDPGEPIVNLIEECYGEWREG